MKNCALKTAVVLTGMLATSAFAQTETGSPAAKSGATFWIDHNVLTWSSDKVDPENGNKEESDSLQTTPDDLTIAIFWNNFGIRVKPSNAGGAVGLSLFPQKEVELGVLLGTNRGTVDVENGAETETTSDTIGLFGNYYYQIDSLSTLEFSGSFAYGKTEVETKPDTGPSTETENKSNTLEIGVQYAYQVAEHFHVIPGIFFNTGSAKTEAGGTSSDVDNTGLTLNLAHFRYVF